MKTLAIEFGSLGLIAAMFGFVALTGCEKSTTMIEPGSDSYQTLIISKGKKNPFGREALEDSLKDEDYYAIMWVVHSKGEQSQLPLPDHPGGTWGGTYNHSTIQLWSIKDRQTFAFADLGTVELGDTIIPVWKGGGVVKYEIGGELRELTHYYQLILEDEDDPSFTGPSPFTITNSPDIQDVSAELNLPEKNIILNVSQGQTVNPNADWVIELKHPIVPERDGVLLYERSDKFITNNWPNQFEGVSHLIIQVTGETDVIRIPSQALLELRRNSSVNLYTLELNPGAGIIARIPLNHHDGTLTETQTIASIQSHLVEFMFQE